MGVPDATDAPGTQNNPADPDISGEDTVGDAEVSVAGIESVIDLAAFADEVFRLTNMERAKEGLLPLTPTAELVNTAELRAKEIIQLFSHDRPNGSAFNTAFDENGAPYRLAGENLGKGQKTPAEIVAGWMNSSGHRTVILNSGYTHLGVGVAIDANGTLYWAQSFTD